MIGYNKILKFKILMEKTRNQQQGTKRNQKKVIEVLSKDRKENYDRMNFHFLQKYKLKELP